MNAVINANSIKQAMTRKGYVVFGAQDFNLNLIGVRAADLTANTFNDVLCVLFSFHGIEHFFCFPCTTDPGLFYRLNPVHVDGTGILKPDQYRSAFALGLHRNEYPALVQVKPVTVLRDNDKNDSLEFDGLNEYTGMWGLNIHRANANHASQLVDKWSAACQVIADPCDFEILMAFCKKAAALHGNSFTYTLLEERDFT